jgi:hypothetical protein
VCCELPLTFKASSTIAMAKSEDCVNRESIRWRWSVFSMATD